MVERSLAELLSELIRIPSVNPDDTDDARIAGEMRVAEFVAAFLEARGFSVDWQERESGRPNVIGSYGDERAKRTVLFEAHLDTVGVDGMTRPPFEPCVEGGRLYGRGACDDKGPMAAALHALTPRILDAAAARGTRMVFVGAMGEEKGNIGAEKLAGRGFRADHAVILEPTDLAIVHAHKGALWFELEVRGKAGHGSNPALGVNAITAMADVIRFLHEATEGAARVCADGALGKPTVSIGGIRGGGSVNIVPDRCVIQVDRRVVPEENRAEILERIRGRLDQMTSEGRITGHEIRVLKAGEPFRTSVSSRLVEVLGAACNECGVTPRTEGAAWYSDAGALSKVCREIVVFGPGSIRQAHTADEFIELDELERGSKILELFAGRI